MHGAILPFPQDAFMAWCSVKAQGQLYLYLLTFIGIICVMNHVNFHYLFNEVLPYHSHVIIFDS
jgi:hypothetical protein